MKSTIRTIHTLANRVKPLLSFDNNQNLCVSWPESIRNVMIMKKPNDNPSTEAFINLCNHLNETYDINIVTEPHIPKAGSIRNVKVYSEDINKTVLQKKIDLIITLGGDGTIIHASSLFEEEMPPILSFSFGTLGFLMPFGKYIFKKNSKITKK